MSGRKYYCYCDSNCKFETMTKEQILAAIEQAARWDTGVRIVDSETNKGYALYVSDGKLMMRESDGSEPGSGLDFDLDTAIVDKVKETNNGGFITFWVGTQAQYNAIENKNANCFYHITDSKRDEDINERLNDFNEDIGQLYGRVSEVEDTSNDAKNMASNAVSVANSKTNGMVREQEYNDVFLEQTEITKHIYKGTNAKFYIVEASLGGERHSVTIPYRAIRTSNPYVLHIGQGGSYISATINDADQTVTFNLRAVESYSRFLHISGYY